MLVFSFYSEHLRSHASRGGAGAAVGVLSRATEESAGASLAGPGPLTLESVERQGGAYHREVSKEYPKARPPDHTDAAVEAATVEARRRLRINEEDAGRR